MSSELALSVQTSVAKKSTFTDVGSTQVVCRIVFVSSNQNFSAICLIKKLLFYCTIISLIASTLFNLIVSTSPIPLKASSNVENSK